ncbi:hypothetical protein RFI_18786 [Reticulomyxa filosa]|uniref:GST N-terminal domain-containing protein n=1 Tax=Reticulomyxa filosa TaxID=46433 RepID=X6MZI9_RETFI|nr:hypothetical protein RFI_18786 [Reticulomyxa filosa]|eukprot:ETO18480.1 hypothetical protein RFI_18786 [Reticulomyxa filosa]
MAGVSEEESRFRGEAKKVGGKIQFPLLVDENEVDVNGESLYKYECDDICKYLLETYGDRCELPWTYTLSRFFAMPRLLVASLCRPLDQHGNRSIRKNLSLSKIPDKPLEVFSYEASPFSRRVREVLSSLEIPYYLRNTAHGSVKRNEFKDRFYEKYIPPLRRSFGLVQLPLVVDPNVDDGKVVLESTDIVDYLKHHYW